ncbi:MAG: NAD-dependent epimerase/dehydratase family protein [Longimicrobiales bacterium]
MTTRRDFLAAAAATGAGLGLGGVPLPAAGDGPVRRRAPATAIGSVGRAAHPLRLLFLGGTGFLGPAEVEYALARGHTVTLFNRGRTNTHLFPDVEKLVGDRAEPDYSALEGRTWDAVLDTSANLAPWVADACRVLEGSVGRYLFVSSLSAHSDNAPLGQAEDAPVFSRADYQDAVASGDERAFGPNKAEGERVVFETFGDRGLVVRPGLIVGPGDRSDRFTYWPVRMDRGGEVVAPGDGTVGAQIVDVRDLGGFNVRLVEQEAEGTYNAVGPEAPMSMAEMLHGVRAVTAAPVRITWIPAAFLREHDVGAWMEMPVWVYPGPETAGFMAWDNTKAIEAGLTFRPLADTARDTLAWWKEEPGRERALTTGLSAEKEAAILRAWHQRG